MRFRATNAKIIRAIDDALSPDNVKVPKMMTIQQRANNKELIIRVEIASEFPNQIETLISTLDEFVSHIQTASQAIEKTEVKMVRDRSKGSPRRSRENKGKSAKKKYA